VKGVDLAEDPEVPLREIGIGNRAVVQDRELLGPVLTGRNPLHDRGILLAIAEETLEHGTTPGALRRPVSSNQVTRR
jgi:hypothetical protein